MENFYIYVDSNVQVEVARGERLIRAKYKLNSIIRDVPLKTHKRQQMLFLHIRSCRKLL